jgi:two-component system, chemotaxis family, chemotaxis protein CheY
MNPSNVSVEAAPPRRETALESNDSALSPERIAINRRQFAQYRKKLKQDANCRRPYALIVEDQPFSRGLLYAVLRRTCSVRTCADAKEGWNRYLDEVPDIVFLDIGLPGTNGHVLAEKIKGLDPLSYIVMVTASQDVHDLQMAKENHVDGFIVKPFNLQKIDDCIDRYRTMQKEKDRKR